MLERGTPALLMGELWGRLARRGAERVDAGWRRRGLDGSWRSLLGVRLLRGLPMWLM